MAQTLDGYYKPNDLNSYSHEVGILWRKAIGNWNFAADTGAQGEYDLFVVTGTVIVNVFGVCQADITSGGAATIEVGIPGNTAGIIAQTTFSDLDQYELWVDAAPTIHPAGIGITGATFCFVITNGYDVRLTIGTADLTGGDIDFYALWMPLSADGNVVGV